VSFDIGRLREIREARNMSQAALAAHLRVGLRSVVRWETEPDVTPRPIIMAALEQWAAAGTNGKRKAR
jgi:DNA-binding transcriptional regulator YiaG